MKITPSIIAVIAVLASPLSLQAAENPWYVGVNISSVDLDDIDSQSTSPAAGVTRNLNIGTDSETGFGIKIGKTVHSSAAGELDIELNYAQSDHDVEAIDFLGIPFTGDAAEGELEVESLLLRAAYKFSTGGVVKPYVGLGIGITDLSVDARYGGSIGSASQTAPPFATGSDNAFAIEARVGADWSVSDAISLFAEYSFADVSDIEFERLGGGPGGLAETTQESDFDFEAVTVGINFRF